MSTALLTLNTAVPSLGLPASPVIVFYDNGDWEIAFDGDVDYIKESGNLLASYSFIDLIADLFVFFDLGDADDIDEAGEVTYLYISEKVIKNGSEEPVLGVFGDGEAEIMTRHTADMLVRVDAEFINFASALDLFEGFRDWRGRVGEGLFGDGSDTAEEDEESTYENRDDN